MGFFCFQCCFLTDRLLARCGCDRDFKQTSSFYNFLFYSKLLCIFREETFFDRFDYLFYLPTFVSLRFELVWFMFCEIQLQGLYCSCFYSAEIIFSFIN